MRPGSRWPGPLAWYRRQPVTIRAAVVGAVVGGAIASVGAITAEFIGLLDLGAQPDSDSGLRLVDVEIQDSANEGKLDWETSNLTRTSLDVKVRNVGGQTAFLKRAELEVLRIWVLDNIGCWQPAPSSFTYNGTLALRETPYQVVIPISQSVGAGDVDRFSINLQINGTFGHDFYVFLARLGLVYDEDDKTLTSSNLLFLENWALPYYYYYNQTSHGFWGLCGLDNWENATRFNRKLIAEIEAMEGVKSADLVLTLDSLKEIRLPEDERLIGERRAAPMNPLGSSLAIGLGAHLWSRRRR